MKQERVSSLHSRALQGDHEAMAKWAADTASGGTYYRGRKIADTFGAETAEAYTVRYRKIMNRRAASKPSTPEGLGVGSSGIEAPSHGKQRLISAGNNPQNDRYLRSVVRDLFIKSEQR